MIIYCKELSAAFECSANKCPYTCCQGWNIIIDKATYQKMLDNESKLGVKTSDWMAFDGEKANVLKDCNNVCPMLNENGLCQVVLKLGPEYLSETCEMYPRLVSTYGPYIEHVLSISCPEVLRLLAVTDSLTYEVIDDGKNGNYEYEEMYSYFSYIRAVTVAIFDNFKTAKLQTKIYEAYKFLDQTLKLYKSGVKDTGIIDKLADGYTDAYMGQIEASFAGEDITDMRYSMYCVIAAFLKLFNINNNSKSLVVLFEKMQKYFVEDNRLHFRGNVKMYEDFIQKHKHMLTNMWSYGLYDGLLEIPEYDCIINNYIFFTMMYCYIHMALYVSYIEGDIKSDEDVYRIASHITRCMTKKHTKSIYNEGVAFFERNNINSQAGIMILAGWNI